MFGSTSNSSGNGLFGSNNNTGGGLFGGAKPASTGFGSTPGGTNTGFGTNTSTNANTGGGGLFGSNNNTNAPGPSTNTASGGLFGAANNNAVGGSNTGQPASGSLFGSQNNTSQVAPSGGLFGNNANNAAPNASGGLFGNSNANASNNTNNASTNTSGGLFGSSGNTSNTGGGLFGSNNANNNTTSGNTGATGGLFGNKRASSGGLFGSSNNTSNTGGGLFGSNNASGTTGGGLFNNNANTNTGSGGLFGSNSGNTQQQQPPNSQQSGGLFGQNNTNAQPSGGLFGQNTTNNQQPSFGWSNQNQASNQTSQPLFDTTNKLNNPNLNNPNSNFNSNNNAASNYNNYTPAINDQLIKIKEQWDPNSAKCALKTHLYNKLNDQEINVLLSQQRPSNESPEDWDNAMSNRPTPHHYPIKVTSFTDVAQRIETQLDHVAKSRILLNGINEKQSSLSSKHDLDNTTRILKAKARHVKLLRRLLRLATVLAILKLKGYPLLPEEEELSKQFDLLNQKLNDPNGSLGKLNDVFARLAILKERSEDLSYQFDSSLNSMNNVHGNNIEPNSEKDIIDDGKNNDEVINKLSKLLLKQQVGLNHLNNVLEKDLESVNKLTIKN